jgi:hypothetical protein
VVFACIYLVSFPYLENYLGGHTCGDFLLAIYGGVTPHVHMSGKWSSVDWLCDSSLQKVGMLVEIASRVYLFLQKSSSWWSPSHFHLVLHGWPLTW